MALLPITLATGQVAIYGTGTTVSPNGLSNINADGILRWGSIYQVWPGGETYIYGNDNVMFNEKDVVCRIVSSANIPYTIIPARLATKQEPLL